VKKKNGFTLIELLVVIAILALILAIMIPGLGKAKDIAKLTVCLAHLHSLGVSWVLYAKDYDSKIPGATTSLVTQTGSNPRTFRMNSPKTWVGWYWESTDAAGNFIIDKEAREACIKLGTLYPYNDTLEIYRCPVGVKDELRTYAIVDSMNGARASGLVNDGGEWITKVSQLRYTSKRIVFIDEGWASTSSWTIFPKRVQWWDRPPVRHDGTTVSKIDRSAVHWKWKDQRTTDYSLGELTDSEATAENNVDFTRLQQGAWGLIR